jgi:hypothetical protein
MCAWPALPHYKGEGDPNAEASFACVVPAGSSKGAAKKAA